MSRGHFESVEHLDEDLARLARGAGRLRYALGRGLEALARGGGHHELGFSSVEAYALERCRRSARWTQQTRALARRLAVLPALEQAVVTGSLGLSMAQLLAKVAVPEDEAAWLAEARSHTVRQMRARVEVKEAGRTEADAGATPGAITGAASDADSCTLTVSVAQEDVWVFECARMMVKILGGPRTEETVEALLGEGSGALLAQLPRGAEFCVPGELPEDERQKAWEEQRARWREESEVLCEAHFATRDFARRGAHAAGASQDRTATVGADGPAKRVATNGDPVGPDGRDVDAALIFDHDATAIDSQLRSIASALVVRELELGRLAEIFWKADGWRRLGYATDTQYVRERLGMGLSSLKGRRQLARRVEQMPELGAAIRSGVLGYESARLVASVAVPETAPAWIERGSQRTVKHLREEVDAVRMLGRLAATAPSRWLSADGRPSSVAESQGSEGRGDVRSGAIWPPSEATMAEVAALEAHVVSGAVFVDAVDGDAVSALSDGSVSRNRSGAGEPSPSGQMYAFRFGATEASPRGPSCLMQLTNAVAAMLSRLEPGMLSPPEPDDAPPRRSARAGGRVTVRLRVSRGLRDYYRWLERLFMARGSRGVPFLRFLCVTFIETWKHSPPVQPAYAHIYARDRNRCTSPVCIRGDVTPHHLRFRSAGGDESTENLTSLCTWCHLEGIHGGRLRATPPASRVSWTLGSPGREHTRVDGRRREPECGVGSLAVRIHRSSRRCARRVAVPRDATTPEVTPRR